MTVTNDCWLYVRCVTQTFARNGGGVDLWSRAQVLLGPVYMEWGTPVWWGWFLLFSRSGRHKTKETYPTRPGSPTPCKQGLSMNGGKAADSVYKRGQGGTPLFYPYR